VVGVQSLRLDVQRAVPGSQYKCSFVPAKFSVAQRISRKEGFGRVLKAENIANKNFRIFFLRNNETGARLGIITSKKVLPKAVDRNQFKRVIRETFRKHQISLCKLDIVVMVRLANLQLRDLREDSLQTLFSRIEKKCAEL